VEGTVTWVALGLATNLIINSVSLLFVVAQSLRLTSYLSTREYRDQVERRMQNSEHRRGDSA